MLRDAYGLEISTDSAEALAAWDAAIRSYLEFRLDAIDHGKAMLEADPECAMAWWGVAYAAGPNYNKPWEAFDEEDAARSLATAHEAVAKATKCARDATATERALIQALEHRYPSRSPAPSPSTRPATRGSSCPPRARR